MVVSVLGVALIILVLVFGLGNFWLLALGVLHSYVLGSHHRHQLLF